MSRSFRTLYFKAKDKYVMPVLLKNKQKIFCIGKNKTGTTSLTKAILDLGYIIGDQRKAERLIDYYKIRDFKQIIAYCKTAEFFQDVPFSWPFTFIAMDVAFPGSKFILTIRDSAEQWYNSLIKFHSHFWGESEVPTKEQLQNVTYCYKGWVWKANQILYNAPEDNPYQKDILINDYETHNLLVQKYFHYRQNDLLVLNIAQPDAYIKLCEFLKQKPLYERMPWKNKLPEKNI
ncbi:MAG TPA: sulfotransferase [Chitinophagaceae bacterium]